MKKAGLIIVLVIFLINLLDAQILHVNLPDTMDKSRHYTLPSVWGDRMVIIDKKYSSFNPEEDYFFRFYKRINRQWNLQSSIKAKDYHIIQRGFRGYMVKDYFIILSIAPGDVGDNTDLFIFKEKNDSFILNDKIELNQDFNPHAMAVSEDWILVRLFTNDAELTDYFIHNEQDHWILRDKHSYPQSFQYVNNSRDDRADISKDYAVVSNYIKRTQHKSRGILSVYKRNGLKWDIIQKIYEPNLDKEKSNLGYQISMSPNGRLIATRTVDGIQVPNFFIFKMDENTGKYELDYQDTIYNRVRFDIGNEDLIIASDSNVWYHVNQNDNWRVKCKLNSRLEGIGGLSFGSYYSEFRQGETAVTGHRINDSTSLITTFQIPARDTLSLSICQGAAYDFNGRMLTQSGHYVDTLESSYCIDSVVQLYLNVHPTPRVEIDTFICPGDSIKIGEDIFTDEGEYEVVLESSYGCDSIVQLSLGISDIELLDSTIISDYGCGSGAINISIDGNNPPYAFDWSTGERGEDISGLTKGTYSVTIRDKSGCELQQSFIVPDSIPYLIPNAFFPSGTEEINKNFKIYQAQNVHIESTQIFDRWGEKVYESEGDEYWDGSYKGKAQAPGVYLYKIVIDSPCGTETETGQVLLLR